MPKFMNLYSFLKMDKANEGGSGGGGGQGQQQQQGQQQAQQGQQQSAGNVTMTQAQFDAIMARLPQAQQQSQGQQQQQSGNDDLATKAAAEAKKKEQSGADSKALESAIMFNTSSKDWLKTNTSLLPKDVEGIFSAAEKETYDNQVQKASAIKSGVIQTFFKVQENLDFLTAAQKSILEDWQKLTKNGKEEKAQQMFDSIFEPTFEMLKRIKKAQQVQIGGQRGADDAENAYKEKLMKSAQKHFMGVKTNA
jgi:hypothetical protein